MVNKSLVFLALISIVACSQHDKMMYDYTVKNVSELCHSDIAIEHYDCLEWAETEILEVIMKEDVKEVWGIKQPFQVLYDRMKAGHYDGKAWDDYKFEKLGKPSFLSD